MRFTARVSLELARAVRDAVCFIRAQHDPRFTLEEFFAASLSLGLRHFGDAYNGGRPFPHSGAINVPRGRPPTYPRTER